MWCNSRPKSKANTVREDDLNQKRGKHLRSHFDSTSRHTVMTTMMLVAMTCNAKQTLVSVKLNDARQRETKKNQEAGNHFHEQQICKATNLLAYFVIVKLESVIMI